ncbi:MAG: hypothetical protein HC841_03545, partial [Verrucomicrobiae bacterium]|nr:hypothetical protein [Verrucomicrobiae bacterium]
AAGIDGISFAPTLLGRAADQKRHDMLYWEFHERGFAQAIRMGNWKGVRNGPGAPLELYNLAVDIGEKVNVAGANPEMVSNMTALLKASRTESPPLAHDGRRRGEGGKSSADAAGGTLTPPARPRIDCAPCVLSCH